MYLDELTIDGNVNVLILLMEIIKLLAVTVTIVAQRVRSYISVRQT